MRRSIFMLFSVLIFSSNVCAASTVNEFTLTEVKDWSLIGNFPNRSAVMSGQNATGDILQTTRAPSTSGTWGPGIFVTGSPVAFEWRRSGGDLFGRDYSINGEAITDFGFMWVPGVLSITLLEPGPVIPATNPDVFMADVPVRLSMSVVYNYRAPYYQQDERITLSGSIDGVASHRFEKTFETSKPGTYFYDLTNVDYTFAPSNAVPEPSSVVVWSMLGLVAIAWTRRRSWHERGLAENNWN